MAAIENVRGTLRFGEMVARERPEWVNVGHWCVNDDVAEWMAEAEERGIVAPCGAVRDTLRSPTEDLCLDRGGFGSTRRERVETVRAQAMRGWKVSDDDWLLLQGAFDFRCVYCDEIPPQLTKDHVRALARGGRNVWRNIVPACRSCNSKKNVKTLAMWFGAEPAKLAAALDRIAAARSKAAMLRRKASG